MRRMLVRGLGFTLAVMLTLACSGSGADDVSEGLADVSLENVAAMIPALDDLDTEFAGMEADSASGSTDNDAAALRTADPGDGGADLARLGRIGGQTSTYWAPERSPDAASGAAIQLWMELDLFQDRDGAGAYFAKQVDDFDRLVGEEISDGWTLEDVDTFAVKGLGGDATGLVVRTASQGTTLHHTVVAFRMDRLVAAAGIVRRDDADMAREVPEIARAMANRVEDVSAGDASLRAAPARSTEPVSAERPLTDTDESLAGAWRVYSQALFYDAGGSGGSDAGASTTRRLHLSGDGGWAFGSSRGTWYVTAIDPADWQRWDVEPYGPELKVVLDGWSGQVVDGPIEGDESGVSFFWMIYRVDDPSPGVLQTKFGHP